MRYFDKDLDKGVIYTAFNDTLIGFKCYQNSSPVFCVFDVTDNGINFYNIPFIINSDGVFSRKTDKEAVAFHRIIKNTFKDYLRFPSSHINKTIEQAYLGYCDAFYELAIQIPHQSCECCDKISLKSNNIEIKTINGTKKVSLCLNCINNAPTCSCCSYLFLEKDGEVTRDKRNLCPVCKQRKFVLPYHRYYPNVKFFGKVSKDNPQPYLGVELEVDEGGENNTEVAKILNILNKNDLFAYCSHDSSLSHGFEIITQPATLTYHNSIKHIYKEVFDKLISDGYVSHDTSTCGLHIHFNRDFYADDEELYITRLLYLIDKFWDDIVRISRRNQRKMYYTKKVDMPVDTYVSKTNKSGNHDYHYYAINLINQETIEFRMFRGTLKVDTFLATLQFVNNCIIVAKTKSAEEIQRMSFEELITGRTLTSYWKKRKGLSDTEE